MTPAATPPRTTASDGETARWGVVDMAVSSGFAGAASLAQLERDSAADLTNGSPRLTNCTAASATMDP